MKIARWLALVPALVLASFVSAQTLGPPNFVTTGGGGSGGGSYTLPIAATGTLGGIKPDGTTITVNGSTGVASAVGGSGTVTHNGSLASGYLVIGGTNGTTDIKTDSAIQDNGAGTLTGLVSLTTAAFNVTGTTTFTGLSTNGPVTVSSGVLASSATLSPTLGGEGVANNSANTVTFSGNYGLTLTLGGTTGVTLPTSGTLLTTAGNAASLTFGSSTGIVQVSSGTQSISTALANGTTVTTQAALSGDTKAASDAYADRAGQAAFVGSWATPDTTAAVDTLTLTAPVTIIYTDPTAALRTYQLPAAAAGNKGMAVELIVAATQATYHVNFKPAASDVFYLAGAALTVNHYVQDASTTKGDFIIGESDGVHWSFAFGTGYSGTSSWADAASP